MRITSIGHASYLVEAEGQRILCDPVLSDERVAGGLLRSCPARAVDLDAMPPPTAIALSHVHADHFHPLSWQRLSKDLPVLLPAVDRLVARVQGMGYLNTIPLGNWQSTTLGEVRITATPSLARDTPEVAFHFQAGERSFWNTVDSDIPVEEAQRLGRVEVVAAKYQPVLVQTQILTGRGTQFDKSEIKMWLEAALAPRPDLVFPAACGMSYQPGLSEFMNHLSFPLSAHNVHRLLEQMAPPHTRVVTLLPGDVIEWEGPGWSVRKAASRFVRCLSSDTTAKAWEPFDLRGLDAPAAEAEVRSLFLPHLTEYVVPRLQQATSGPFSRYAEWDVVWQGAVHLSPDQRLTWSIDFRGGTPTLYEGPHIDANYFLHVSGRALVDMLSGRAGPNLFWQGGGARAYEKVFRVRDGRLEYPGPFFEVLPEFLTSMTMQRIFKIVAAVAAP
ncbi:MAG TPA: MBL fold metallo-hydrolase [Candidatus Xenobia bacterium]|jgi:L-ascorbate metabolism protein UlaG (beta-lactamase superfamily)